MTIPNTKKMGQFFSQALIFIITLGAFAAGWFVSTCLYGTAGNPSHAMTENPPLPAVTVQEVKKHFIDKQTEYIAHVMPIQEVDLRPRIEGYIAEIHFEEGSLVEKGQLLVTIDPREYEASVHLKTAELAKAEAKLVRAEKYLNRLKSAESRSISQADLDTAFSDLLSAKAALEMAHASLELAEINLGYTRITAPIGGRIGQAAVKAGNYVSSATQRLARIIQVNPVRIAFSPADSIYLKLLQQIHAGARPQMSSKVILPGGIELETTGTMDFVNNEMDPETGTIKVWMRFNNPDGLLIPGTYVKLILDKQDQPKALAVPRVAVLTDASGDYVFVVNSDSQVEQKQIISGDEINGKVIVESGLSAGESIIVDGIQKVRPGITVNAVRISTKTSESTR